jgi:hypothetical protein
VARSALGLDELAPLVKFAVYSSKDDSVAYYIGSKPSFKGNASPTGRSTRTFIVYGVLTTERMFMEDTWRIDLPGMEESELIQDSMNTAHKGVREGHLTSGCMSRVGVGSWRKDGMCVSISPGDFCWIKS